MTSTAASFWGWLDGCSARALRRSGLRRGPALHHHGVALGLARAAYRQPRSGWRSGHRHRAARLAQDDLVDPSKREVVWLVMEWPDGEETPTDFTAATLPATMTRRELVRRIK